MANIFDYLKWRGDLDFHQSPINSIDNLIFSRLSYIPFDHIVSEDIDPSILLKEVMTKFVSQTNYHEIVFQEEDIHLLKELAASKRFGDLKLCAYVNSIDYTTESQFSAITIVLDKDIAFIAFRGTDNTIIGWKEDFNMTFTSPIHSQELAVEYVNSIAKNRKGNLYLGGHSKGGNLAVYSGYFVNTKVQKRIHTIYNNDGPGLNEEVIKRIQQKTLKTKIKTFVPQVSIVGMLLERKEAYQVVKSSESGILQHDVYSWNVLGTESELLEERNPVKYYIK